MNTEKQIGQIVRSLRGDMSLREFAALCDISHTALDAIECGVNKRTKKPTQTKASTLQRIANAAGVPISYIIGEETEKNKTPSPLSEGETKLLDLFKQVPADQQEMLLDMIEVALKNRRS